jgi:prefoldin subunit 5
MAEPTLTTLAAQLERLMERIDSVERNLGERIDSVERTLDGRIDAVERKLDVATGGGKVTLAFLSRQLDKILREQAAMRAELRTHTAALTRLDSSVQGLVGEVRARGERQQVQDKLWRQLEERVEALEEER